MSEAWCQECVWQVYKHTSRMLPHTLCVAGEGGADVVGIVADAAKRCVLVHMLLHAIQQGDSPEEIAHLIRKGEGVLVEPLKGKEHVRGERLLCVSLGGDNEAQLTKAEYAARETAMRPALERMLPHPSRMVPHTYVLLEDAWPVRRALGMLPHTSHTSHMMLPHTQRMPVGRQVLGLLLAHGCAVGQQLVYKSARRRPEAGVLGPLSLRKRQFVSQTAMQPEIALLMANLAGVGVGDVVLDPFCGSCSLLLACASLTNGTCETHGFDADVSISKSRDAIAADFLTLALPPPIIGCADVSFHITTAERETMRFDAIVTDPPYDMRASVVPLAAAQAQRVNCRDQALGAGEGVSALVKTLLDVADSRLKKGGKLVFFHPTRGFSGTWGGGKGEKAKIETNEGAEEKRGAPLPGLPEGAVCEGGGWRYGVDKSLETLAVCKQEFSPTFSRWLIVMQKTC